MTTWVALFLTLSIWCEVWAYILNGCQKEHSWPFLNSNTYSFISLFCRFQGIPVTYRWCRKVVLSSRRQQGIVYIYLSSHEKTSFKINVFLLPISVTWPKGGGGFQFSMLHHALMHGLFWFLLLWGYTVTKYQQITKKKKLKFLTLYIYIYEKLHIWDLPIWVGSRVVQILFKKSFIRALS
jgi:hypothetical protein